MENSLDSKSRFSHSERHELQCYLNSMQPSAKVLVIGCGRTPQNALTATNIPNMACSLGRNHKDHFTIDVSENASPDLVMDFVGWNGSELGVFGLGKFDAVEFEYISRGPRHPFRPLHIQLWLQGADMLLKPGGLIQYYSGDDRQLQVVATNLAAKGYRLDKVEIPANSTAGNLYGHKFIQAKKPNRC
ncbi:hypothetical protein [Pantoea sp. SS70]|uniref:hypothetical protein n=1 Tax=Pantoea sp. SS70 TaxID=3024247 RepID=UPI002452898C|nr:hypothetical protein [Pantoea sp. SS70]WGK60090.1 hypothetical protein PO881_23415 [Pantoea sp. SS70]